MSGETKIAIRSVPLDRSLARIQIKISIEAVEIEEKKLVEAKGLNFIKLISARSDFNILFNLRNYIKIIVICL